MDPVTIAALGTQALTGVVQGITGIFQTEKANKMARKNIRPKYDIQQGIEDNQALVESKASEGLSDNAKQVLTTGSERGLSSSIDAILKGGGSVNNIADIYDNFQGGISKLSLVDEEMRAKHVADMIAQNREMAGETEKKWQINEFAPYADKAQAAATLAKQGSDNLWKGINTFGSSAGNLAMANEFGKDANSVFPKTSTDSSLPTFSKDVFTPSLRPSMAKSDNPIDISSLIGTSGGSSIDPAKLEALISMLNFKKR